MTVEKVILAKTNAVTQKVSFKGENEESHVQQSSGSTKDVVTVLSVLAAIGAAGVAIYKHKNAKEAVKKAEEEAKKKIDEAEKKAKKAAEEANKKVQDAVDKVKKDNAKKPVKAEKDSVPTAEEPVKKTKKSHKEGKIGKGGGKSPTHTDIDFRLKLNPDKSVPKPKVSEPVIEPKPKAPTAEIEIPKPESEPKPKIEIPAPAADGGENVKKPSMLKRLKQFFTRKPKSAELVVEPKPSVSPIETEVLEEEITEIKKFEKLSNMLDKTKGFFSKKWKSFTTTLYGITHKKQIKEREAETDFLNIIRTLTEKRNIRIKNLKNNIKQQLSGNTDYKKLADALVNEPNTQARHDALQALYNTLAVEEPKAAEIFKGIKIPDVTKISEENLLAEYRALTDVVKNLSAENPAAQRYLAIQGELFNHRGYHFQDGKLIKTIKTSNQKEKTAWQKEIEEDKKRYQALVERAKAANKRVEEGQSTLREIEENLDGRGKLVVDVPRKHNKRYHNKLQKEYDKLAINEKEIKSAAERAGAAVQETIPLEYRGLSEAEKIAVERAGILQQEYGSDKKLANELSKKLEELGIKEDPIKKLTPELSARIGIVSAKSEKSYWQSSLNGHIKSQESLLKDMESKGIKPLEASDEEIYLQVEYVEKLNNSKLEKAKGDEEWAARWLKHAEKASEKLKTMGKEPLDFSSDEMKLQLKLFQLKRNIKQYTRWVNELDKQIEKCTKELENILGA